jgi:8-oxo-dGTP pyrophosphatase MutT (NUDIX family)
LRHPIASVVKAHLCLLNDELNAYHGSLLEATLTPLALERSSAAFHFAQLAQQRLPTEPLVIAEPTWSPGDFDLNMDAAPAIATIGGLRPAAVLIPIIARDTLTVLLTRRAVHLAQHAGQIAFPGGKIDADDRDARAAALREASEEIGLDPTYIQPLGFLDTYRTGTGFQIEPLVALVAPGFTLTLDEREVAETFEVPLNYLMSPANHQTHTKLWQTVERRYYAMPYENYYIWGATAGILKNMHERLFTP